MIYIGVWLGREDSNLRMAESKSAALPLGYAPVDRVYERDGSAFNPNRRVS